MTAPHASRCDILCCSNLRWDPIHHASRHLMTRAARDRRAFYVEEPRFAAGPAHLSMHRTAEGVMVVTPTLPLDTEPAEVATSMRALIDHLITHQQLTRYVLWCDTPLALAYVNHLDPTAIVYACVDDPTRLGGAPDELQAYQELLLSASDLVFTSLPSVQAALAGRHDQVHLIPDAVDVAHLVQARRLSTREQPPPDHGRIAPPRVGFFGFIDRRLDLDLLAGLADLRPDLNIVMIGPAVAGVPGSLPRRPNVHWLGIKTYDELPYYLAGWAAAILPYARDESTRHLAATHVPELLAAGRAVIATSIPDLAPFRDHGLIRTADTPQAMSDAFDAVRAEPARDRNRRSDRWLADVSWDRTWALMDALLERAIAARADAPRPVRTLRSRLVPA